MKSILYALILMAISITCNAHITSVRSLPISNEGIEPSFYYEYMDTFDFCGMVDTCLHFPNDSTKFLNGNGNWVNIVDSITQRFKYIAYGNSTNHITGDSLFTRDPIGQMTMQRIEANARTGFYSDTTLHGTAIGWSDSIDQISSGMGFFLDPSNYPYPQAEVGIGDGISGNYVNALYHIDDTTGGIRNWRINQTAYNGTTESRTMCNLSSSQSGDVHGEMESASDLTGEKSNIGLYVPQLTIYHEFDADSVYLGCTLDTSGFWFWNYGRSGMGIGGYHFPLYHGSNGQVLTDDGTGQLFWDNNSSSVSIQATQIAYGNVSNNITSDSLFTRDTIGQMAMQRNEAGARTGFYSDTTIHGTGIRWLNIPNQAYAAMGVFLDALNYPYPQAEIGVGDGISGSYLNSLYHIDDTTGGIRNWRINNTAYNGSSQSRAQCDLASHLFGDVHAELGASNDMSGEGANVSVSVHQLSLFYKAPLTSTSINSFNCTIDSNGLGLSNNTTGSGYYFPKNHGNAGQTITDDGSGNLSFSYSGVLGGSFDSTLSASSITINLPFSLPSTSYKVVVTASNSTTANRSLWVDSKSVNSFNVNLSGSASSEIKFDWILAP